MINHIFSLCSKRQSPPSVFDRDSTGYMFGGVGRTHILPEITRIYRSNRDSTGAVMDYT